MIVAPPGFDKWIPGVSSEERADPLWRMSSYRLARFMGQQAWGDTGMIRRGPHGYAIAEQLLRAIHSIPANIAEGYSRGSGHDRVRMFEYALGSTREAVVWYEAARPLLPKDMIDQRLGVLVTIRRLLLTTIQRDRHRKLGTTPP